MQSELWDFIHIAVPPLISFQSMLFARGGSNKVKTLPSLLNLIVSHQYSKVSYQPLHMCFKNKLKKGTSTPVHYQHCAAFSPAATQYVTEEAGR